MTDALGNDIVIGNIYGYSNRSNGHVTVVIGTAKNITAKGNITLDIVHRGSAVYQHDIATDTERYKGYHQQPHVSVSSNSLFPLTSSDVKWGPSK